MRSPRLMHDGSHFESWPEYTVRVAQNNLAWYDFFGSQDNVTCGKHGLFAYAYIAPQVRIAVFVAALDVNNGHVGTNGRYQQQGSSIQRRLLLTKCWILTRDIAA